MKRSICLLAGLGLLLSSGFAHSDPPGMNYHQVKKMDVGGDGGWDYLTYDGTGDRLFISRGTRVSVVDVKKGTQIGEIPNTTGVHGIALAPKLNRGFTSNGRDNSVTIFDLKTLKVLDTVKVGKNPDCILFDPATNRVFTFNGGSSDTSAIDAATGKVAGTIALGGRPEYAVADGKGGVFVNIEDKSEGMALDPKTHAIFLATARFASTATGGGQQRRPAMEPNSFMILEFAP